MRQRVGETVLRAGRMGALTLAIASHLLAGRRSFDISELCISTNYRVSYFLGHSLAHSAKHTMAGEGAVEPELDSFSLTFPLPYRVGFIATLGWCAHTVI